MRKIGAFITGIMFIFTVLGTSVGCTQTDGLFNSEKVTLTDGLFNSEKVTFSGAESIYFGFDQTMYIIFEDGVIALDDDAENVWAEVKNVTVQIDASLPGTMLSVGRRLSDTSSRAYFTSSVIVWVQNEEQKEVWETYLKRKLEDIPRLHKKYEEKKEQERIARKAKTPPPPRVIYPSD
jgi:hypothetical protein